ncbi:MAG: GNAT family N-acetyltransferase [Acidimicrobiales bacterium]
MTTVRPATVDDADGMGRVHASASQSAYRGIMPDDYLASFSAAKQAGRWRRELSEGADAVILVAEDDAGGIVGIAAVGDDRSAPGSATGEVRMLNVAPASWGTGIGTALLHAAVRHLKELGFAEAVLWVLEENGRARRFYEREGWAGDGAVKEDQRPGFVLRQVRYRLQLG